jgi:hypothetical protein
MPASLLSKERRVKIEDFCNKIGTKLTRADPSVCPELAKADIPHRIWVMVITAAQVKIELSSLGICVREICWEP